MSSEAVSPLPQNEKPLDQLLGYPSAGINLARGRYPVQMSKETLIGELIETPRRFENEEELKAFCEQKDTEEKNAREPSPGYWRIRSL